MRGVAPNERTERITNRPNSATNVHGGPLKAQKSGLYFRSSFIEHLLFDRRKVFAELLHCYKVAVNYRINQRVHQVRTTSSANSPARLANALSHRFKGVATTLLECRDQTRSNNDANLFSVKTGGATRIDHFE